MCIANFKYFFFVLFVIVIAHFSYMYVISNWVCSIITDMTIVIYRIKMSYNAMLINDVPVLFFVVHVCAFGKCISFVFCFSFSFIFACSFLKVIIILRLVEITIRVLVCFTLLQVRFEKAMIFVTLTKFHIW